MKQSKYSESQIMGILNQAESGVPVADLCREHGMSTASFYKWRAKYGGMDASLISRMKALDEENKRLKKMYAEKSMQNDLLKEALGKSGEAVSTQGDGPMGREVQICQYPVCVPDVQHQRDVLSVPAKAER